MPHTVVIAPDSFKGSLSALRVAEEIAAGWRSVRPDDELVLVPRADGGEGTIDAVAAAIPDAVRRSAGMVTGPDSLPTPGEWLQLPDGTAVVELAQSSGLPLMPTPEAMNSTTRGLGQVIKAAVEAGATSLVIGLGGSASTDGGAGALSALGMRLLDSHGGALRDGGGALSQLDTLDVTDLLPTPAGGAILLTDVTSPLLGPAGAAAVFGPQKGADATQVAELDAALERFATVLGGDANQPGTGAAGGTGFGLAAGWGAEIRSGADYLAELAGLDTAIARADVVLTGEGRFDEQSLAGKVVGQALTAAASTEARVGVIAGQVTVEVDAWTASLTELAGSVDAAMDETAHWLREAGARAARELG